MRNKIILNIKTNHSRRTVLKGLGMAALVTGMLPFTSLTAHAAPESPKVLIAYFSHTGNTRTVAQMIHTAVGGDMLEIKVQQAYPSEHNPSERRARQEFDDKARPALATTFPADMDKYNIIFVGYPNWFKTAPMAMFTFLEQFKFAGKTIVPFTTHGGNGLANSSRDIASACPQATVLEGLAVSGRRAASAQETVTQWLQGNAQLVGLIRK